MLPRVRKLLLWSLSVAIGLILLLTAAVLIAERLIDTPKVRTQLAEKLSKLLHGQVAWEELHVRLLPLPHGVVRGVHVAIPSVVTLDVPMVDVTLGLLPLFHGRVEVQTTTLEQPSVDVWIAASLSTQREKNRSSKPVDPLTRYRDTMRPVLDAVARFAPNTTVAVKDARAVFRPFDSPPFEARKVNLKLVTSQRGVVVAASATGTYWDRAVIDGRMEYADLSARLKLESSDLNLQPALEQILAKLRVSLSLSHLGAKFEAGTDGHTGIDVALDLRLPKGEPSRGAKQLDIEQVRIAGSIKFVQQDINIALDDVQLGELAPSAKVSLVLTGPKHAPKLEIAIGALDLSRLRDATMAVAGAHPKIKEYVPRIHGGRLYDLRFSTQGEGFTELVALTRLHGSAQLAEASMRLPKLEREATKINGHAELINGAIKVTGVSGQVGASQIRQASADIVLLKPRRMEGARGRARLVLDDLLPDLRTHQPFTKFLRSVPTLTGAAAVDVRNVALRFDTPAQVDYDLSVTPQHVRVDSDKLPEQVDLHGGVVRITPKAISADGVSIAVMDSQATVSGAMTGFRDRNLRVMARVVDGVAERRLIDWIWQRAAIDPRLKPMPLRFAAQQVQWTAAGLDVVADAKVNEGPSLSVDLSMRDKIFTLRRATIKDRDSDANLSFEIRDSLVAMGFAGVLAVRSLAPILGQPTEKYLGIVTGNIQATLDLKRQGRNAARGKLAGEHVDLRSLTGTPLKLERFELEGVGKALQIREMMVDWADQRATIRGELARQDNELAMTLQIDSPGIVIDALRGTPKPKAEGAAAEKQAKSSKRLDLWSLPVKGSIALRADFVEYRRYRVQDIRAVATLEHDLAAVKLTAASLCGIGFPLSLRVTPKEFDASVSLKAEDAPLEGVTRCLAGKEVAITGNFNLSGALSASGPMERVAKSLVEHLAGSVQFSSRNGVIHKMTLLSSILALISVKGLNKSDAGLPPKGFEYHSILVDAGIERGQVTFEQAALDSSVLGLAATGTINLKNFDSLLTVLVAPFGMLNRIGRKIPILGYIFGGTLTSIPVSVTGDIRKPVVVPLGPRAVGSEALGVFERAFKQPVKVVEAPSPKPSK